MPVGRSDKACGHIVAEERNFRECGSLLDRQDAAGSLLFSEYPSVVWGYVPPHVTAQIFWLKNRDPAHWRDVQNVERQW